MKPESFDLSENKRMNQIMDFLYGTTPVVHGTNLSRDEIAQELRRRNPKKQFCLVRDWILVELDISVEDRQQIEADGFKAQFIFSQEVVEDSAGRWAPGSWVRTSLLLKYEGDGFFETRSTIYVLLGDGRHKQVRQDIAYSIHP